MRARNLPLSVVILIGATLGGTLLGFAVIFNPPQAVERGPPAVTLELDRDVSRIIVTHAGPLRRLGEFRADLSQNGITVVSLPWLDDPPISFLGFWDADGDGRLSANDVFHLEVVTTDPYELVVFWREVPVGSLSWKVVLPTVALGLDADEPQNMTVTVTAATPVTPLADWSATISGNGYFRGGLDPVREETVTLTQGGSLTYLDMDRDGALSAGDRFVVAEGAHEEYTLSLWWQRVLTPAASVSWLP